MHYMFRVKKGLALNLVAVLLSLVATLGSALVGCGSGDPSETTKTSSLTKAEFIRRAERICAHGSENLLPLVTRYMQHHVTPHQTEAELTAEAIRETVLPKFQIQIDELRRLSAPPGDKKQIEAFLAAMQHATDSLAQRARLSLVTGIDHEFQQAGELALNYGIVNCAN